MTTHAGRLELTWTNKDKTLLAHDDQSYEWANSTDYRVSEVRLLHDVATVGDVQPDLKRATDNLLIRGDAMHALNSILSIPEFKKVYAGRVKLCYIDPPFNTQQAFAQYDDALEHSVWLTMMRDRLVQLRDLLAPDGSLWVHLDHTEVAYCRMVLDELFGRDNFRNSVVWKRTTSKSVARRGMGTMHDTILFYSRSAATVPERILLPYSEEYLATKYSTSDDKGPYTLGDLTAPGMRTGSSGSAWREWNPAKKRRHWVAPNPDGVLDHMPPDATTQDKLEVLLGEGFIRLPVKDGQWPRFKRYLADGGGVAVGDVWTDISVLNSQDGERRGFDTQKPERLLQRIIEMSTKPGDIVLDCFAGSGTTAASAHKMGRRWVTIERTPTTVAEHTMRRLTAVAEGADPDGITADAKWTGGGGFRVLDVGPSMFEEVDGRVYLADWAVGGALGEAVAAQYGYDYTNGADGPFSGLKGKKRLAVVDGLVNEDVIKLLVSALPNEQEMLVCGTAIDEECRPLLKELRKGSTMKKIPGAILDDYRSRRRDRLALARVLDWAQASKLLEQADTAEVTR
jgi:adenine-specific DNA-methyltransferase